MCSRWMEKACTLETVPLSACCHDVGNKWWTSQGCAECSTFAIWQKVSEPLQILAWALKSRKHSSDTFRHVYFHHSGGAELKSTEACPTGWICNRGNSPALALQHFGLALMTNVNDEVLRKRIHFFVENYGAILWVSFVYAAHTEMCWTRILFLSSTSPRRTNVLRDAWRKPWGGMGLMQYKIALVKCKWGETTQYNEGLFFGLHQG